MPPSGLGGGGGSDTQGRAASQGPALHVAGLWAQGLSRERRAGCGEARATLRAARGSQAVLAPDKALRPACLPGSELVPPQAGPGTPGDSPQQLPLVLALPGRHLLKDAPHPALVSLQKTRTGGRPGPRLSPLPGRPRRLSVPRARTHQRVRSGPRPQARPPDSRERTASLSPRPQSDPAPLDPGPLRREGWSPDCTGVHFLVRTC